MYQRVDSSVAKLQLCSVGRCVREFVVRTLKHNAHYLNVDEGRNGGLVLPWEKMRAVKVGRSRSEAGEEQARGEATTNKEEGSQGARVSQTTDVSKQPTISQDFYWETVN